MRENQSPFPRLSGSLLWDPCRFRSRSSAPSSGWTCPHLTVSQIPLQGAWPRGWPCGVIPGAGGEAAREPSLVLWQRRAGSMARCLGRACCLSNGLEVGGGGRLHANLEGAQDPPHPRERQPRFPPSARTAKTGPVQPFRSCRREMGGAIKPKHLPSAVGACGSGLSREWL